MKLDDWQERLDAAIIKHQNAPDDYNITNCWLMVLDAYEAQTGILLFPDLRKYKSEKDGYKKFAKKGFKTVGQALASELTEVNRLSAMRGDLGVYIKDGVESCGVITASGLTAKTTYSDGTFGMTYIPLDKIERAFKVE